MIGLLVTRGVPLLEDLGDLEGKSVLSGST